MSQSTERTPRGRLEFIRAVLDDAFKFIQDCKSSFSFNPSNVDEQLEDIDDALWEADQLAREIEGLEQIDDWWERGYGV